MLLPGEWTDVRNELSAILARQANYKGYVQTVFGPLAPDVLMRIPLGTVKADECATFVLNFCVEMRWSVTPSYMELLLTQLVTVNGCATLAPLLARARTRTDPLPDLFQARWLQADHPFYNRTTLRAHAKELVDQSARPLMRVTGDAGWGRSYTVRFLDYLSEQRGDTLHVVHEILQPSLGPSYEAEVLAEALTSPMGVEEPVPRRTTSSYAGALARFVLRNAMRQAGRWLFVLEGFAQRDVQPEVKELVQSLAREISGGEFRKRLRMVLIDYNEAIPNVLSGDILEESLPPPRNLSRDDVLQCLVALDARRKELGQRPLTIADLPNYADTILADAPADGKSRLEHVYEKLMNLRDAT